MYWFLGKELPIKHKRNYGESHDRTKGRPDNCVTKATQCVTAHTGAGVDMSASHTIPEHFPTRSFQLALRKVKTKYAVTSHCFPSIGDFNVLKASFYKEMTKENIDRFNYIKLKFLLNEK